MRTIDKMPELQMAFLKKRRRNLGLSQFSMSQYLGYNSWHFGRIESGQRVAKKDFIAQYQRVLAGMERRAFKKDDEERKKLGGVIGEKMKRLGLSAQKFASDIGLCSSYLYQVTHNPQILSTAVLKGINDILDDMIAETQQPCPEVQEQVQEQVQESPPQETVEVCVVAETNGTSNGTVNGHAEPLSFDDLMSHLNPEPEPEPVLDIKSINEQIIKTWDGLKAVVEADPRLHRQINDIYGSEDKKFRPVLRDNKFYFYRRLD